MSPPASIKTTLGRFADFQPGTELGFAQARAAAAYGVPMACYVVHGSTGANALALRAHQLHSGRLNVLAARGAHRSIVHEVLSLNGSIRFARSEVDTRFEAVLPPTASQIEEALITGPPVDVVVITSPSYDPGSAVDGHSGVVFGV